MKKKVNLNANLAGVFLRRYRRLSHLKVDFPLQVTRLSGMGKDPLSRRLPYILMRSHQGGISRRIFIFKKPLSKKVNGDDSSILRPEDDGG